MNKYYVSYAFSKPGAHGFGFEVFEVDAPILDTTIDEWRAYINKYRMPGGQGDCVILFFQKLGV